MSDSSYFRSLAKAQPNPKPWDKLGDMGIRVLAVLLDNPGATNKAVADLLGVSHNTTKGPYRLIHEKLVSRRLRPTRAVLEELAIHFLVVRLKKRRYEVYDVMTAFLDKYDCVQQYYMMKGEVDYLIKVVTPGEAEFKRFHRKLQEQDFVDNAYIFGSVMHQFDTQHHELSFLIELPETEADRTDESILPGFTTED